MDKRQLIVQEILTTEIHYVSNLYELTVFSWQLDGALRICADNAVRKVTKESVFCNLEPLWRLHEMHVLPAMKTALKQWSENSSLSDVFTAFLCFNVYCPYVTNLKEAQIALSTIKNDHPQIADMIDTTRFRGLSLENTMMEPFQRLLRYKLLFERYRETTFAGSLEYNVTCAALTGLSECIDAITEQIDEQEQASQAKMVQIQNKLEGIDIIDGERKLIMEANVTELVGHNKQEYYRYLLLLSDQLIIASGHFGHSGKRAIKHQLSLVEIQLGTDLQLSDKYDPSCVLLVQGQHKRVYLKFKDEVITSKWKETITSTKAKHLRHNLHKSWILSSNKNSVI